jgi:hypothetical protein
VQAVPVYQIDAQTVEDAYQAFAVLRRAAQAEPALIENPYFVALQDTAYARFLLNFEAL